MTVLVDNGEIMGYKIGSKVRISPKLIQTYHEEKHERWCDGAEELFKDGRIFTITDLMGPSKYIIDDGIGGSWNERNLIPVVDVLDDDLFEI